MPDNVTLPAASGKVSTREVLYSGETAQAQVVGLATFAGADDAKTASDVGPSNPLPVDAGYGELIEAVEALRFAVGSLTRTIGMALPNTSGQPIMEARQATAANLQVTATISGTPGVNAAQSGVWNVTNSLQFGGFAAQDLVPAFLHLQADGLRANITVT
jgi:hypothetical protein